MKIRQLVLVVCLWIVAATLGEAQETGDIAKFHTTLPARAVATCQRELSRLHIRLQRELGARPLSRPTKVYVYAQADHYVSAVRKLGIEPGGRPAIFVKRNGETYIFTYSHGDYLQTLRHEFTHAVLHDSFSTPPLWLDEGLAEYYEAADDSGRQAAYERLLATQLRIVWKPSPDRMARWRNMEDMRMLEYAEAWSWVKLFMQSPAGRQHVRFWLTSPGDTRWVETLRQTASVWENQYRR